MQRIFTLFPAGSAGLALLSLRGAVICAISQVIIIEPTQLGNHVVFAAVVLMMFLVLVGLVTRIATGLCLVLCLLRLTMGEGASALCELMAALASISLLLVGPGAYAIDALLFGRRRVTFQDDESSERKKDR